MSFLSVLDPGDERLLRAAMRRRRFARNTVVFHEGDPGDSCHVVVEGRFAASASTPLGHSAVLWLPGPGDVFGELSLVSAQRVRTATVTALEDAQTLELHRESFDALCDQHPRVVRVLTEALADHVVRTTELAMSSLFLPVDKRVERQLALLAALYLGGADSGVVPLPQEVLAAMAGTTRPTLNRILKQLEAAGLVELGRSRITVRARGELERRAARATA